MGTFLQNYRKNYQAVSKIQVGTDGRTGRLVPQRNAQAMADAMRETLRDPEETARMGRAARARVERIFQWDQAAAQMVEVFEEVVHASDRRSRAA